MIVHCVLILTRYTILEKTYFHVCAVSDRVCIKYFCTGPSSGQYLCLQYLDNISAYNTWKIYLLIISEQYRCLQYLDHIFDNSTWTIYPPVVPGECLAVLFMTCLVEPLPTMPCNTCSHSASPYTCPYALQYLCPYISWE
jgi:hypothetical protein